MRNFTRNFKKMKISIFTTMTNPEERMDPWEEALECYKSFADEVVVVGEDFKEEFIWRILARCLPRAFKSQPVTG